MPVTQQASLRRNILLSVASTLIYATSQWVLFVILARTTTPDVVGEFSLIVSITAPLYLMLGLNLRVAQATDVQHRFRAFDFTNLQIFANGLCVFGGLLLIPISGQSTAFAAYVLYLAAKAVESMSTNFYGLFQLHGRMDYVAFSLVLRSILGPTLFGLGLVFMPNLVAACGGLLAAWLVAQVIDRRRASRLVIRTNTGPLYMWGDWSRVARLASHTWPLGVSGGVNSLAANVPRYAIRGSLGTSALGTFSGVAYLAQVIQTIVGAIGAAVVPDMSRHLRDGHLKEFRRLLWRTVYLTLGIVAASLLCAWAVGSAFLRMTMGAEYSNGPVLIAMLAGAGLGALYRCPGRGLQAAQRYRAYLGIDIVVLVVTALLAGIFVPFWGLIGAAYAIGLGSLVGLVVASLMLRSYLLRLT